MEPFVANASRLRLGLLLLALVVGLPLGLWLAGLLGAAPAPDLVDSGWVLTAICAIGLPVGIWKFLQLRAGPQIIVDEHGVWSRAWSDNVIPWDAIAGIRAHRVQQTSFLGLRLVDPALHPGRGLGGKMRGINRAIGIGDVELSTVNTDKRFAELEAAVSAWWGAR